MNLKRIIRESIDKVLNEAVLTDNRVYRIPDLIEYATFYIKQILKTSGECHFYYGPNEEHPRYLLIYSVKKGRSSRGNMNDGYKFIIPNDTYYRECIGAMQIAYEKAMNINDKTMRHNLFEYIPVTSTNNADKLSAIVKRRKKKESIDNGSEF